MGLNFQQKIAPLRILPISFAQDRLAASTLLPDGDAPHGKHRVPAQGMKAVLPQHSGCQCLQSPGTVTLSSTAATSSKMQFLTKGSDNTNEWDKWGEHSSPCLTQADEAPKADEMTVPEEFSSELGSGFPPSLCSYDTSYIDIRVWLGPPDPAEIQNHKALN